MSNFADMFLGVINGAVELSKDAPPYILFSLLFTTLIATGGFLYGLIFLLAPTPRAPHPSEKTYITSTPSGDVTPPKPLPCWHDDWLAHRHEAATTKEKDNVKHTGAIEGAEVMMSVVVPAYNEEERMEIMLEEAVAFLDEEYGRTPSKDQKANGSAGKDSTKGVGGYEILIVNDGSKDKTVDVALSFAKRNNLHDILRVCTLKENRGKGGAVTHGFRHVRGAYAVFADADGASKFSDLRKLVKGCQEVQDSPGRGIAVGSRAHMVGTEAVVKRSALRNALMHSFHLLLRLLTPPATSRIRDTQCGFKLFSRPALPHIIPYMHVEGWIFDVEMLMLAESAPDGIRVAEVPVGWQEVGGSKLNVVWDSLSMAWGLAILRASWIVGVYRRR
ncbi:Nucleotide-diphospho-sugar transferase [Glarea lozoyensis ATCC 20868]|uniref:dolichyl-phosphate beta-glucosyltransferase n=1 Tax=Glarea lozoyensis (strain ATCC 20868 / MF5171) TaxID=1116229 RepID=S3CES0_GLAL2|nr:Nucleotide-diphospho-sugar transferase [Glarea lozoyensis ATCC 20868]EPE24495.1 Nucleotide-diphospho-sugar transferase [Glarea lozoyensis ATCC 20868]